jgi:cysteine-rich repeat protein
MRTLHQYLLPLAAAFAPLSCREHTCIDTATCQFAADSGSPSDADVTASGSSSSASTPSEASTLIGNTYPGAGTTTVDPHSNEALDESDAAGAEPRDEDAGAPTNTGEASNGDDSTSETLSITRANSASSNGDGDDSAPGYSTAEAGVSGLESTSSAQATCGDGVRHVSEACDDGDDDQTDGCQTCTVAQGWQCLGEIGKVSICSDVDECQEGLDNCDANASCSNDDGGFDCTCDAGFNGNGTTCDEAPHVTKLALSGQLCALVSDGRIFCWAGIALGNGVNESSYQPTPTEVPGITTAIDVSIGGGTVCALLENRTVKCWGQDQMGQANAVGSSSGDKTAPTTVVGLSNVASISNASYSTCALLTNGTVRCFGSDDGKSTGEPTAMRTMTPLATVASLGRSIGSEQCVVLTDGAVRCWTGVSATPTAIAGLTAAEQVAGQCALLDNGTVKCMGPGGAGQIGNGSYDDQTTPQLVQQLTASSIVAGNLHVCALVADQSLSCWGEDGFFNAIDYGNVPLTISGLDEVESVYAGSDNTCAIETDHTVKCWGSNLTGQLGDDREGNEQAPVVIHGLPGSD